MTEAEWLACADPGPMLDFLRGKAGERKLRLFACACVRRLSELMKDQRSWRAVEVAERFAAGTAGEHELALAEKDANDVWNELAYAGADSPVTDAEVDAADAAAGVACYPEAAIEAAHSASCCAISARSYEGQEAFERERQCDQLRDIFGNPYRPVIASAAWSAPAVVSLARTIDDERGFQRLATLADALEKAGCTDGDALAHCRGPGQHVRGCWVLDVILGKS